MRNKVYISSALAGIRTFTVVQASLSVSCWFPYVLQMAPRRWF